MNPTDTHLGISLYNHENPKTWLRQWTVRNTDTGQVDGAECLTVCERIVPFVLTATHPEYSSQTCEDCAVFADVFHERGMRAMLSVPVVRKLRDEMRSGVPQREKGNWRLLMFQKAPAEEGMLVGVKPHIVDEALAPGLIEEMSERGCSVTEARHLREFGMDVGGGFVHMNRPFEDFDLEGTPVNMPSEIVDVVETKLHNLEVVADGLRHVNGRPYYKLHIGHVAVVLSATQRASLHTQVKARIEIAAAREAAFYRELDEEEDED